MSEDGYPKWGKNNSSTEPVDPSNQINRAKGTQTISDGRTDVVVDYLNKPKAPQLGQMPAAKQHYPPCINPTCKSAGKSHPNCLCYAGPGGTSMEDKTGWMPGYGPKYAHGGCVGMHQQSCEHYADGGTIKDNNMFFHAPNDSLDHLAVQQGLSHVLTKLGNNGKRENPHAHFEDYMDSSKKGHKTLHTHTSKLVSKDKLEITHNKDGVESLKNHLNEIEKDPQKALEVGGKLGEILPDHAAALGSKTATIFNYFQGLKPRASQASPLDPIIPPSRSDKAMYDRQLRIAEHPLSILEHVKKGTLQIQDLKTLHTIYPSVAQAITQKAAESLIESKEHNKFIPYKQKQGLALLLGQPLDTIQTPQAMQAIIQANAPTQSPQDQGSKPKKASGTELKQIDKTNKLSATALQDRAIDQRK